MMFRNDDNSRICARGFSTFLVAVATALLLAVPLTAVAERAHREGDTIVHYNALPTTVLGADVATRYHIERSMHRGFVNIAVLRVQPDDTEIAVPAIIKANATSLIGQRQSIELREIRDQDAIYYIGEFTIRGEELLRFDLDVKPQGNDRSIRVQFEQSFVAD